MVTCGALPPPIIAGCHRPAVGVALERQKVPRDHRQPAAPPAKGPRRGGKHQPPGSRGLPAGRGGRPPSWQTRAVHRPRVAAAAVTARPGQRPLAQIAPSSTSGSGAGAAARAGKPGPRQAGHNLRPLHPPMPGKPPTPGRTRPGSPWPGGRRPSSARARASDLGAPRGPPTRCGARWTPRATPPQGNGQGGRGQPIERQPGRSARRTPKRAPPRNEPGKARSGHGTR